MATTYHLALDPPPLRASAPQSLPSPPVPVLPLPLTQPQGRRRPPSPVSHAPTPAATLRAPSRAAAGPAAAILALVATATLVLLALAAMAILVLAAWRVRARRPAWQKRLRARISSPFLRTPRVRKRRLKSVRVAWSQLDQDAASEMGCEVAETPSRHPGDVHDL